MHSEPSAAPMKSQSSARLRSIRFGLHSLVLRLSWTVTFFTPLPLTTILRDSQLSTASRPFGVSLSSAVGALPRARTLVGLVSLRSCWRSKVEEWDLSLTLPSESPLTLTSIPPRFSACFWLVATFSDGFLALSAASAAAAGMNTATATAAATSLGSGSRSLLSSIPASWRRYQRPLR